MVRLAWIARLSSGVHLKLGLQEKLFMGNLDSRRDRGYAKEYVEAMWLMLQQPEPDDYVIATNETHTIREYLEVAFGRVGLDWQKYVGIDPRYYRPAEVELLIGDASKAKRKMGWEPKTKFKDLIELMVDTDLADLRKQPFKARPTKPVFLLPPPKGSVLTFDTKGAIATYWLPGWPLRVWKDWAGRRLCRPPAELGNGRAPAGALRKGGWGAFSESAEEGAAVGRGRDGRCRPPLSLSGGRRVGGPGHQGGRSGCGGVQRVAWNSSRLGVRTARRSKFLSVGSLPMALTRSRSESGTWPNRVSRTSRIASRAVWTMPFSRPSLRASSSKRVMWGMAVSGRRCWSWFLN
jgi:hypothetical protein